MNKTCTDCGKLKPLEDFSWKIKELEIRQTKCKECFNRFAEKYRLENRETRLPKLREYGKEYYRRNRERILRGEKADPAQQPSRFMGKMELKERHHLHYEENKETIKQRVRKYTKANPQKIAALRRLVYFRDKLTVIYAYGGPQCACCRETTVMLLTIDHIDGCTPAQRKQEGIGSNFYRWLIKSNFPPGYQILCYNCNLGRAHNGGTCPHKTPYNWHPPDLDSIAQGIDQSQVPHEKISEIQ